MRMFVKFVCLSSLTSSLILLGCSDADTFDGSRHEGGQAGRADGTGAAGAPAEGTDGVDGKNGKDGNDGVDGEDGKNGKDGADGSHGVDGKNGSNGADGKDGGNGADGRDGMNGEAGVPGKTALVKQSHELAGDNCGYGGIRVESGVDQNSDGALSSAEVNATLTQWVCNTSFAWNELPSLPTVNTAYGFALGINDTDGSPRLGFIFKDDAYRQKLLASNSVLWDGGGVYTGTQVFGVYQLGGETGKAWVLYEGRLTPQYYQYSDLTFNAGQSYYTTSYPSFGGLISVVKSGQYGTYALTPAFTTRKAHSVGFFGGQLFALIAQKAPGLTLSMFPIDKFGMLSNLWVNLATLETDATTVIDPVMLPAGDRLVAGYVRAGKGYVRASKTPQSVAQAGDFPIIGQTEDAVHLSVAWDGTKLYMATISSSGSLKVQRAALADTLQWEVLTTHVTGTVSDVSLAGKANSVLLGVRQGGALRVYLTAVDDLPSFDAVLPGNFSLVNSATGPALAVMNLEASATHTLRSFMR